ncbi:hypothetical protein [Streptomyces sp. NPDC058424]|uniref:hypothetical protein n=1 Tax=Streptomyces sp. NPDC058424 TaxID=3346491 RepID=UPI003662F91F
MPQDGHHTASVIAAQAHPAAAAASVDDPVVRQGAPQTEHGPTWRRPVRAITWCQSRRWLKPAGLNAVVRQQWHDELRDLHWPCVTERWSQLS